MHVRRAELAKRRQEWDMALRDLDLRDPSAVDRRSFRMLRLEREEDWSDWLAQLLEDSKTGSFAEQFFGGTPADSFAINQVRREVTEEARRADIVVEWQDSSYTHLEVKVGDSNLAKTFDTAVAIEQRFQGNRRRRGDFILFLPEQCDDWDQCCQQNPDLGNRVAMLTWFDAARALRLALRQGRESPAWRVWAHTFCGAIEQKLLGIPAGQNPEQWTERLRLGRLAVATELLRTVEAHETR